MKDATTKDEAAAPDNDSSRSKDRHSAAASKTRQTIATIHRIQITPTKRERTIVLSLFIRHASFKT
jgi:hypothetical protein